jgi:MFS family permease
VITAAPVSDSGTSSAYAWYVVGVLSLANMVSYVDRQILSLLVVPIKRDLGLSDTEVSLLAGFAFALFYATVGLFIGKLADTRNRKIIISFGVIFWSLATAACGLAKNFWQLFLARVAVGAGEATLSPSATSILSDYFPAERLGRVFSFYTGAQYVGAGLALVVGGAAIELVMRMGDLDMPLVGHLYSWQLTFIIVALPGLLVLVLMVTVKEPKRKGVSGATLEHAAPIPWRDVCVFMLRNWRTYSAHFVSYSISSVLGFGTVAWIPTYFIRIHGWEAHDIGYVYGMMVGILGTLGVFAGARLAEYYIAKGHVDGYLRAAMVSQLLVIVPGALAPLMPSAWLAFAFLIPVTFLKSFPVAVGLAALQQITPNQMRARVVAIYLMVASILGVGLGPTVVALITDFVYQDEMAIGYSLATVALMIPPICALLLWRGLPHYRKSSAEARAWA